MGVWLRAVRDALGKADVQRRNLNGHAGGSGTSGAGMGDTAAVHAGYYPQAAAAMPDKRFKAAAARYWRSSYRCERTTGRGRVDSARCAGAGPIQLETSRALDNRSHSGSGPVGNLINLSFAQTDHSTCATFLHQPANGFQSGFSQQFTRAVARR